MSLDNYNLELRVDNHQDFHYIQVKKCLESVRSCADLNKTSNSAYASSGAYTSHPVETCSLGGNCSSDGNCPSNSILSLNGICPLRETFSSSKTYPSNSAFLSSGPYPSSGDYPSSGTYPTNENFPSDGNHQRDGFTSQENLRNRSGCIEGDFPSSDFIGNYSGHKRESVLQSENSENKCLSLHSCLGAEALEVLCITSDEKGSINPSKDHGNHDRDHDNRSRVDMSEESARETDVPDDGSEKVEGSINGKMVKNKNGGDVILEKIEDTNEEILIVDITDNIDCVESDSTSDKDSPKGKKLFTCEICNKKYIGRTGLAWHMKVHTGERPFLCSQCGNFSNGI